MPVLSGAWPLCRIGRALGFGQVKLADEAVIKRSLLPVGAVPVIAALMYGDFLTPFPQEGKGNVPFPFRRSFKGLAMAAGRRTVLQKALHLYWICTLQASSSVLEIPPL